MPIAKVQLEDGRIARFEVPEGTTPEQVASLAKGFSRPQEESFNPTEGMTPTELEWAGVGKGLYDIARGLGQFTGLVSRADVEEARKLDAPLMETAGGQRGAILGNIVGLAPTAAIPGANTMAGAALIGAGSGLAQPSASTGETVQNTFLGGLLGPAALGAGRLIGAAAQGAQALIDPFTDAGQQRIASRTMQAFAGGPQRAAQAAQNIATASPPVAGVRPTAAELARNGGIAQLERTLRNNPDLTPIFTERLQGNRGALLQGLQSIAGDDVAMASAVRARQAAASPLYDAAGQSTATADQVFAGLLQRPSIQRALTRAQQLAMEAGGSAEPMSGRNLHFVKQALDDMISDPQAFGIGGSEARAVAATRDQFLTWLDEAIPEYGQARAAYSAGSRPINQMEIGRELVERFQPALSDFGADSRTTAATYAIALRNADRTAQQATGFPGARMESVMDPQQMEVIEGVAEQLARRANAENLGRGPDSPTAQNLISQNLLRQVLGPLGLPESAAENALLQTLLRPAQFVGKLSEPRILNRLAEISLDPQQAQAALIAAQRQGIPLRTLQAIEPYLAPAVAGTAYGMQQ